MKIEELIAQLKDQAETLVKRGGDVRAGIAHLVEGASSRFYATKDGLATLVKAVAEGAVAGAKGSMPEHADSVLKQVVDGVTDGLGKSAQAVRLTVEEARANGSHFASEDLRKIADDFREVARLMGDILTNAAGATSEHLKTQARSLGEHAQKTLQHVWPTVESTVHAAVHEPTKLGQQSVQAGTTAVQEAAGVLFTELGRYFEKVGDKLRRGNHDPA